MNTWRGLEEFVAVAQTGSFRGAALALRVSSSHISRAVSDFEAILQAPLFFRSTRRVRLTDTGRALLPQCERLILERDEMLAVTAGGGAPSGVLRISCATSIGEKFIAPLLQTYVADHPNVSIDLNLTNRLIDLVGEGFDLAVRTGRLEDSSLIGTKIATRKQIVSASPDYIKMHGRPDQLGDLEHHNCLIGTQSVWQFKIGDQLRTWTPKGSWRANSGKAVLDATLAGMGISQLPHYYVEPELRSGRLVELLIDNQISEEPIWAVYPHQRHSLPKLFHFVSLLKRDLQSMMHPIVGDQELSEESEL